LNGEGAIWFHWNTICLGLAVGFDCSHIDMVSK